MYYVYILECDNAFFYVGLTSDVQRRLFQHQNHESLHTKRYKTVKLVCTEEFYIRSDAEKRERQLKGWSKAKKKALIQGDTKLLENLSQSKS